MPFACKASDLSEFQCLLIGTWSNVGVPRDNPEQPLSYNVMPLPQRDVPQRIGLGPGNMYGGFILKNFRFTEEVRFNGSDPATDPVLHHKDAGALAVTGAAPNRGGAYTQLPHALFYEQQVRFAEGPDDGKIVHLENGAWLHFGSQDQENGPYRDNNPFRVAGQVLPQPPTITVAKQMSIPHGNSILALGKVDLYDQGNFSHNLSGTGVNTRFPGKPVIPDAPVPYPIPTSSDSCRLEIGISTPQYDDPFSRLLDTNTPSEFENPDTALSLNPNYAIQRAVDLIDQKEGITHHIHVAVTTNPLFAGSGVVTNIPFEDRKSKVTGYSAEYWLLSTDGGKNFNYFAYSQTILMEMEIYILGLNEYRRYVFPHLTSNTVKKLAGTPDHARATTAQKPFRTTVPVARATKKVATKKAATKKAKSKK